MSNYACLTRSGFDLEIAVFLAEVSEAAYGSPADLSNWANSTGLSIVKTFDRGDVQGFFCSAPRIALLAFRGTSNLGQWLRDARFVPWTHPWGLVHHGFLNGVNGINIDLQEFDVLAKSAEHVWITGHSLGGGLALIAAARSKMKGVTPSLYTYGQPRVGFGSFADRFSIELPGRLIRFVNQSDIVPRVPPGLLYRHTGIVKRIVRPGVLEMAPAFEAPPSADPLVRSQMEGARRAVSAPALESAMAAQAAGATEPVLIETDLAPLSEKEFAEIQLALGAANGAPALERPALEGVPPWISDHAISEYIRLLKELPR
ncbi:MAG TPA: lipase family protein [Terriglobales bacterium]|nr:lipase family protein [Terriglobales bacterium]